MLICPACGKQLPDGSIFCEQCGSRVAPQSQPMSEPVQKSTSVSAPSEPAAQPAVSTPVSPSPVQSYQPSIQQPVPGPALHNMPVAPPNPAAAQPPRAKKPLNKFLVLFIAACAVVVLLIGVSVVELLSIKGLKAELVDKEQTISDQTILINDYETQLEDYEDIDPNSIEKADFLNDFIVIIPSGDTNYHNYDCPELADMDTFRAFNIAYAQHEGYTACPTCQ
ncbi:MAG: zinc-ribbon domain-containing protein [Oscillospiraceae bacterium]|jgi:hypothetical protein